jgi:hypothetical protein
MMRGQNVVRFSLVMALALAIAGLFFPRAAHTQKISQTAAAGVYSVTLKVLPAESFSGVKAEMIRDGGAQPNLLSGAVHPNHHMVAFITKSGAPVEDAQVTILYRRLSSKMGAWTSLPVVRMHMAGMGAKGTHFGNNLRLSPGNYEVHVTVNGDGPVAFHFAL